MALRFLGLTAAATALGLVNAGAQSPSNEATSAASESPAAPSLAPGVQPPAFDAAAFAAWLDTFKADAQAAGIDAAVVEREFSDVAPIERVLELNENQPEFAKAIWTYLDSALSDSRIETGRTRRLENASLLTRIEAEYGVDAEIIVAIWGLESAYGALLGDYDAVSALATLAWRGRRIDYGREQLVGALKILQSGYATRAQLKGSWAGAMGHTQFIPTTYLNYAVDADSDGRRDVWSSLSDVFASTANYLSASAYRKDAPWGLEVRLPADFDYALSDPSNARAAAAWAGLGVSGARGALLEAVDPNARGRLVLPAGAKGPAFLVFNNFEAILRYNRSTAYALAVGLLSDHVARRTATLVGTWPRNDRPLTRDERIALQQALTDNGFDPGPVDGVIGANTKRALRAWQQSQGLPADGYASAETLALLTP